MSIRALAITTTALIALAAQSVSAWEIDGYNAVVVPGNSDAIVSVPFVRGAQRDFTATGTTGTAVTIAPGSGIATNEFQALHYVRFTSGQSTGKWSTITSNTTTDLVLENASILTGVVSGDTFSVYRHQTFESVFPDAFENLSYKKSASGFVRSTEVIVLGTGVGINKAAAFTYYYLNGEWRRIGSALNQDNAILPPQSLFILRNGNNASTLTFYSSGHADQFRLVQPLTVAASANDVPTATGQPTPRTLAELNLGGTSAFVSSASGFAIRDQIIIFNNAAIGQNKAAFATYYHLTTGGWRKIGSGANADNDVLPPGAAFLIRKFAGAAGTVEWTQNVPHKFDSER